VRRTIVVEDTANAATGAGTGDNIARVEGPDADHFAQWTGTILALAQLPAAVDVDGEADQTRLTQGTGFTDQTPEPIGGFENVQSGVDAPGLAGSGWYIVRSAVKAGNVAHGAGNALAVATGMIDVGVSVVEQSGEALEDGLIIVVTVKTGSAAYDGDQDIAMLILRKGLSFANESLDVDALRGLSRAGVGARL
jgi:hypothetical protein